MKILLISQYFYPEQFKCNDVAFELQRRGHDVTVVTGIPNYPKGKYYSGYGILKRRKEEINGVKVIRCMLVPRGKCSTIRLALNYFSFAFTSTLQVIKMCLFQHYNAVLVHETSPVTVGIPGVVAARILHAPLYFWVLDLWPESLQAAGGINNRYILGGFDQLTRWIYRHSKRILLSSRGFEQSIKTKGHFEHKLEYFPNWADREFETAKCVENPELPKGFIVMFAGNIGEAQDFENVMAAALLLKARQNIHFVLVGDGRKKTWVDDFIKRNGLSETVHCLGRHPLAAMPSFFAKADVMLVSLKDELIFRLTAPAKLQTYMYSKKPIVTMLNGEGSRLVREANCGFTAPAGDSRALAEAISKAAECTTGELQEMGLRGRKFYDENFHIDKCMDHLCNMLNEDVKSN